MEIRQLLSEDIDLMLGLLRTFGEVFDDKATYVDRLPSIVYLKGLLSGDSFIALVALIDKEVIGGIAAYELKKFEQERSEIYLYDLAVVTKYRRQGVASVLIKELQAIAKARGAYVIFVQADTGIEDEPAIALYTKLGTREDVLHFDIQVKTENT